MSAKGIMQWASVVEEVLDLLHIDQCSIMAHSAGAPMHCLSLTNCPPVSEAMFVYWLPGLVVVKAVCWLQSALQNFPHFAIGGYKWLKYVPNSILKTAQAAEWKIQARMIGKPPTIAYEVIGYNAPLPAKNTTVQEASPPRRPSNGNLNVVYRRIYYLSLSKIKLRLPR